MIGAGDVAEARTAPDCRQAPRRHDTFVLHSLESIPIRLCAFRASRCARILLRLLSLIDFLVKVVSPQKPRLGFVCSAARWFEGCEGCGRINSLFMQIVTARAKSDFENANLSLTDNYLNAGKAPLCPWAGCLLLRRSRNLLRRRHGELREGAAAQMHEERKTTSRQEEVDAAEAFSSCLLAPRRPLLPLNA